jgi:hypothetical protein
LNISGKKRERKYFFQISKNPCHGLSQHKAALTGESSCPVCFLDLIGAICYKPTYRLVMKRLSSCICAVAALSTLALFSGCQTPEQTAAPGTAGVSATRTQRVTWQAQPFPSDSDWPGPKGQRASIMANGVVLDGQPVRSVQLYTGPATMDCNLVLDGSTAGDSALWLFLIPTAQSMDAVDFTNAVFFQLSYSKNGRDTIGIYQRHSPARDTALWTSDYPVAVGATNHVTLGVAANGQLSLSVNGQSYSLPNTAAISFSQFQLEMMGWQPNDIWIVLDATVTTPAF